MKKVMNSFEEIDEVHIFSNHTLDVDDINNLATQLAETFNINIEYCIVQNGTTLQNTIAGNIASENIAALYSGENNGTNYVLEIGEAALFISNQILVYNLATIESFEMLTEKNNLISNSYYKKIIDELHSLGATEIFFAQDSNEIRSLKQSDLTFEQYSELVKANSKYFTLHTNILVDNN
jgi:hypothetical protein